MDDDLSSKTSFRITGQGTEACVDYIFLRLGAPVFEVTLTITRLYAFSSHYSVLGAIMLLKTDLISPREVFNTNSFNQSSNTLHSVDWSSMNLFINVDFAVNFLKYTLYNICGTVFPVRMYLP